MASSQVLDEVKTAMIEYYTLLSRMPHFPADSLLLPPPEGWPDMDIETLRTLGRSDAAIEFVRHLPCLKSCVNSERAWITPVSRAIAFHRGETWPSYIDTGIAPPTPAHLFYLSLSIDARDGVYLCVDTEQGTLVELAGALKEGISWDDEETLPNDEKWTAYRALPAKEFFDRESVRLLNLFYMPVPPSSSRHWLSEPRFYERARNLSEEEAMLRVDDEWEADHEDDPDYVDGSDESLPDVHFEDLRRESDDEGFSAVDEDLDEDEDISVDIEEVEGLQADTEEYERTHVPSGTGCTAWQPPEALPRESLRVYDIYKRNGWPYDHFNVEQCRTELLDFAQERENEWQKQQEEYDRTRPKTAKEWAEDRRQRMKNIWRKQGKPWDEEKEKTQSAEEWLAEYNRTSGLCSDRVLDVDEVRGACNDDQQDCQRSNQPFHGLKSDIDYMGIAAVVDFPNRSKVFGASAVNSNNLHRITSMHYMFRPSIHLCLTTTTRAAGVPACAGP